MNTVDLVGRVASETGAELRGGGQAGDVWELSASGWGFGPEGHERTDLIPIHPGPAVPGAPVRLEAMLPQSR